MKISIITVTYNSSRTIKNTLDSILAQSYSDIEYIIIDGSSKDNTLDIIKEYQPRFENRMRWISEPDEGIYDAMNKGIQMATGELIGLLNSDDFYIDNNAVSMIVSKINLDNADCIYANVLLVDFYDTNKTIRIAKNPIVNKHVVYKNKISKYSIQHEMIYKGWHPNHPTFFVKKELYHKYGTFNTKYKIEADFDLMFRLLVKFNVNITFLDENILKMREGGASTASFEQYFKSISNCVKIIKSYGYNINFFHYFWHRILFKLNQFSFYGFLTSLKLKLFKTKLKYI